MTPDEGITTYAAWSSLGRPPSLRLVRIVGLGCGSGIVDQVVGPFVAVGSLPARQSHPSRLSMIGIRVETMVAGRHEQASFQIGPERPAQAVRRLATYSGEARPPANALLPLRVVG